jgi:hypothetical protein
MLRRRLLSLIVVVILSLTAAIPVADADSSMIQNLQGVYYRTTAAETVTAPAPAAPSIRILQDSDQNRQGQDNVPNLFPTAETVRAAASTPCSILILQDGNQNRQGEGNVPSTLSSVIVEYRAIEGDGYGKPPDEDVPTDQEEKVERDLSLSVATTTDTRNLNDSEGAQAKADSVNNQDNDNEIIKSENKNSVKDDTKWVILVAVLGGASFLLMIFMLVLVCRALRRNRLENSTKQVEGENATAATAAETAANHDATYDASETDHEFSEHPDIHEIYTDSDNTSEASFV